MMRLIDCASAQKLIREGEVIAYPTEACFGLGCDPFNSLAVETLLRLKGREASKGLILVISNWDQLAPLIACVSDEMLKPVRATWPGHVTWIFPKSPTIPSWLSGDNEGIAVRMTAHPVARALCLDKPLVSTSANVSGQAPALDVIGVQAQFPKGLAACVLGALGGALKPSEIYDLLSGKRLR